MSPEAQPPPAVVALVLFVGLSVATNPLAAAGVAGDHGDRSAHTTTEQGPPRGAQATATATTETPGPSETPTAASTVTATPTPTATATPASTSTPTVAPSNGTTPTETPASTETPTSTPTATSAPNGTATTTPTPTEAPTPTATPTSTPSPTATPTSTPSPAATPSPTPSPTATPTPTAVRAPPGIVVTNVSAPGRVRAGATYTVTATVRNPAEDTRAERIEYVFADATVTSRAVALSAGESREIRFEATADGALADSGSLDTGTYVHGVRNASGEGVPRYLRVSPGVDLTVDEFRAPATAFEGREFVVLATVTNPVETTITRRVSYRFGRTTVAGKTITVGGGAEKQVAFAVDTDRIRAAGAPVEPGRTYDHAVVTASGAGAGDAVRLRAGSGATADALRVEGSRLPDGLSEGGTYAVGVTVRNVETTPFAGQFVYRVDGSVVETRIVEVPAGERRTVEFDVAYADVERAAAPLSARTVTGSVLADDRSLADGEVTVRVPETATPTPTPRGTPAFEDPSGEATENGGDDAAVGACARGFFSRCGGTDLDQTTLTIVGTVSSVLGILYEMLTGG